MKKLLHMMLAGFLLSCSSKDFSKKYNFSGQKLSHQKSHYILTNKTKIKAEAADKNISSENISTVDFDYDLSVDSTGERVIQITYNKFHIEFKKDDEAGSYDSETNADEQGEMDKVLKSLKGSIVKITANKNGNITGINGGDEIARRVTASLPDYKDNSNELIKKKLSDLIGEKFVKENILQNLSVFPDTTLSIGNSWNQKVELGGELPMSVNITYTLGNVENGVGEIQSASDFKTEDGKPLNILGSNAVGNLKGTMTGSYKARENTGFLISAETGINISGSIDISMQSVPVSIVISKTLKAKE